MVGNQIKFDDQVVARFLTNIYKQRFNIDSDIEAEMFRATRRIMADAMATGIADAVDNDGAPMPSETFLNNLRHSAEVFSAFRVHKMQTDVASQMVDANGKLKTFAQFRKDVEPYVSHRNRAWLRTEYDTAVIRAHQATDWQQFESEKDVFPNLEWIPSTSPHPGADHQVFWGTVRPVNDSFWSEHRPGDRWNCKCELRQTEADATIPPMPTDADNPQPGLENNPGRDGELFSQKHPYYPSGCMSCPFAGGHLAALMHGLAHKQNCHQCEKVNKVIDKAKRVPFDIEGEHYDKTWELEYHDPKSHGYIVVQDGHGASERQQNVDSAKPLANDGHKIKLIKQKTEKIDSQKKKISTHDAIIDGEKWEFKLTKDYQKLDKTIGTKAGQAISQGAESLLIDIYKNDHYSNESLVTGVDNAFCYNPPLQKVCVMIESKMYMTVSRDYWENGQGKNELLKWLQKK